MTFLESGNDQQADSKAQMSAPLTAVLVMRWSRLAQSIRPMFGRMAGKLQSAGCVVGAAVAGSFPPTTVTFSDVPKAARASFARYSLQNARLQPVGSLAFFPLWEQSNPRAWRSPGAGYGM